MPGGAQSASSRASWAGNRNHREKQPTLVIDEAWEAMLLVEGPRGIVFRVHHDDRRADLMIESQATQQGIHE